MYKLLFLFLSFSFSFQDIEKARFLFQSMGRPDKALEILHDVIQNGTLKEQNRAIDLGLFISQETKDTSLYQLFSSQKTHIHSPLQSEAFFISALNWRPDVDEIIFVENELLLLQNKVLSGRFLIQDKIKDLAPIPSGNGQYLGSNSLLHFFKEENNVTSYSRLTGILQQKLSISDSIYWSYIEEDEIHLGLKDYATFYTHSDLEKQFYTLPSQCFVIPSPHKKILQCAQDLYTWNPITKDWIFFKQLPYSTLKWLSTELGEILVTSDSVRFENKAAPWVIRAKNILGAHYLDNHLALHTPKGTEVYHIASQSLLFQVPQQHLQLFTLPRNLGLYHPKGALFSYNTQGNIQWKFHNGDSLLAPPTYLQDKLWLIDQDKQITTLNPYSIPQNNSENWPQKGNPKYWHKASVEMKSSFPSLAQEFAWKAFRGYNDLQSWKGNEYLESILQFTWFKPSLTIPKHIFQDQHHFYFLEPGTGFITNWDKNTGLSSFFTQSEGPFLDKLFHQFDNSLLLATAQTIYQKSLLLKGLTTNTVSFSSPIEKTWSSSQKLWIQTQDSLFLFDQSTLAAQQSFVNKRKFKKIIMQGEKTFALDNNNLLYSISDKINLIKQKQALDIFITPTTLLLQIDSLRLEAFALATMTPQWKYNFQEKPLKIHQIKDHFLIQNTNSLAVLHQGSLLWSRTHPNATTKNISYDKNHIFWPQKSFCKKLNLKTGLLLKRISFPIPHQKILPFAKQYLVYQNGFLFNYENY